MTGTSLAVGPRAAAEAGPAADVIGWTAVGIGAVGAIAVTGQRLLHLGPDACAARVLLGVPCPVCGLSTSAVELAHGHVGGALASDALGVAFILTVAVLSALQLARTAGIRHAGRLPAGAGLLAAGLLLAHWVATATGVVALAPLP